MSDERTPPEDWDPALQLWPPTEKFNHENDKQRAIREVLEAMAGRRLAYRGLTGVSYIEKIPDFESIQVHQDYGELKKKINALEKSLEKIHEFGKSLHDLESIYGKEVFRCRDLERIFRDSGLSPHNAINLIGIRKTLSISLAQVFATFKGHKDVLEEERRAYFPESGKKGRKKNARAYLVAEKLARFYLRVTQEKPTYGTDYGLPSTRYTRALEKIFSILNISSGVSGPAQAACNAISEDDVKAEQCPIPLLQALFDPDASRAMNSPSHQDEVKDDGEQDAGSDD
jgi:hypothetical protein